MCGRFIISKFPDDVARWFGTTGSLPNSRPRYNAAPTQEMSVVRFDPEIKARTLDTLRWGLVPYWAKDVKIGYTIVGPLSNDRGRPIVHDHRDRAERGSSGTRRQAR